MEAIEAKMDALYLIKEMLTNQQYIDMCETVQKEYFAETDDLDDPPNSPNNFTDDLNDPDAVRVIRYQGINHGKIYLVEQDDEDMVYDIDGAELEGYKYTIIYDETVADNEMPLKRMIFDENGVSVDEVEKA